MIDLIDVYYYSYSADLLYALLKERTPKQSISHKGMPSYEEHQAFIASVPYKAWYIIVTPDHPLPVGATYLTHQNEIGIFIFEEHHRKGYAKQAVEALMSLHRGNSPFLANINPDNKASIAFFKKLGAQLIQHTYEIRQ